MSSKIVELKEWKEKKLSDIRVLCAFYWGRDRCLHRWITTGEEGPPVFCDIDKCQNKTIQFMMRND